MTRSRTSKTSSDSQSQTNQNHQQNHHQYDYSNEQARRAEQARREAEARARRSEKEQSQNSKAEDPPPESPTADHRSPEEILSLKGNWTQEDLRTAYKREAGRTHPDKWIGKPQAIRHAMEEEFKTIQQAYDQLKT